MVKYASSRSVHCPNVRPSGLPSGIGEVGGSSAGAGSLLGPWLSWVREQGSDVVGDLPGDLDLDMLFVGAEGGA